MSLREIGAPPTRFHRDVQVRFVGHFLITGIGSSEFSHVNSETDLDRMRSLLKTIAGLLWCQVCSDFLVSTLRVDVLVLRLPL